MNGIHPQYHYLKSSLLRASKLCFIFSSIQFGTSFSIEKLNSGYSKKIIGQVNKVVEPLYKLFAEIQQGSLTCEYTAHRECQCNAIIANLEILRLHIVSRANHNPTHKSTVLKCYNTQFNIPCKSISYKELNEYPSKKGVDNLIKNLEQLKLLDSKANLNASEVLTFHQKMSNHLDLIATYENILNQ